MTLAEQIMTAFKDTLHPGQAFTDISITPRDEGSVDYFSDKSWQGHKVKDLHYHYTALSFFTPKAFRYFLPAFMLADLESNIFSDFIAQAFTGRDKATLQAYLDEFTKVELEAVKAFLRSKQEETMDQGNEWSFDTFANAKEIINWQLEYLEDIP